MAQLANSFATFNSSRVREQLMDKIWNVSVSETPTLALVGKMKCDSPLLEWLTDSFRAGAANRKEQGNEGTVTARADVVRYTNRTQLADDTFAITGTQQASNKAGGQDEVSVQEAKSMMEVKKDVEFGFLQNTTAIVAASGTAPQARGLLGFIATNTSKGVGGADPVPTSNTAPTDGTTRAFTETLLKDALKLMFDNGAPDMDSGVYALIPSAQRGAFDAMLGGATRFDKSEDATLTATLEVYIGPYGRVKAVNARHMRTREIFLINPSYIKLATLQPMSCDELAKTGNSRKKQTVCEWTAWVGNEKALGAVRDLS